MQTQNESALPPWTYMTSCLTNLSTLKHGTKIVHCGTRKKPAKPNLHLHIESERTHISKKSANHVRFETIFYLTSYQASTHSSPYQAVEHHHDAMKMLFQRFLFYKGNFQGKT